MRYIDRFEVERIVDERVGAGAGYCCAKAPSIIGVGPKPELMSDDNIRERPGRRGIPRILDGRIIVGGKPVGDVEGHRT